MTDKVIPFDDLLKMVKKLTPEQKQILRENLQEEGEPTANKLPAKKRIPDLHAGAIWTSDDFDDPLPDEFWLGEDA